MVVDNVDTKQVIESNAAQLQKTLLEQGVKVDRFEVSLKQDMQQHSTTNFNDDEKYRHQAHQKQYRTRNKYSFFNGNDDDISTVENVKAKRYQDGVIEILA